MPLDNLKLRSDPSAYTTNMELSLPLWHNGKVNVLPANLPLCR